MSPEREQEIKEVALKDHPFLLGLLEPGMTYQGYSPDHIIKVAASKGNHGDWSAYMATPTTPFGDVLRFGSKIPQQVAHDLFPEWAEKGLNWRS